MRIDLAPQLVSLIQQKVERGLYPTAGEVVRAALQLLDERDDHVLELRAQLATGFDQMDRGEGAPQSRELFRQIELKAAARARAGDDPDPDVCP